ncbi:hypothetical protein SLEP1_g29109 [Rubroshorea leprosula]|uniref:Uncharacterized protein n=1 Tax=Rubroshorea leprosula TaxID=152421 RepID=A0AAV5K1J3_9ROSI|nr:hypothetical protein SLEP1_g29109 [Rubroshorea leprosula]
MEAVPNRSELRKEQERERRRLRDRQRRQSMSLEEREKHLARRRRNYQLRRQRAQTALSNPQTQFSQTSIGTGDEDGMHASNHLQLETSVLDFRSTESNDVALGGSDGQERLIADSRKAEILEIPADKLAIIPGKLRLNRIKQLARVIHGGNSSNGVVAGVVMDGNATPNCKSVKGLRLNRIKRLARAINPAGTENTAERHQSVREG